LNLSLSPTRMEWVAGSIGGVLLLVCVPLSFDSPQQGLLSYLFAFLFFTGLAVGSLALLMVQVLAGGAWGDCLRGPLWAAARTLPLQGLLVVPILLGLHMLYPWARADLLAHDSVLRAQSGYLNPLFYVIRTVLYFGVWLWLLGMVGRRLADPTGARALPRIAAVGLVVYAISTLLAATDWAMSLLPHWHSSTFGLMVATGWMLAAAALAILRAMRTTSTESHPPHLLLDLGNLLLMFVLAWSYLAFMQYLTIWIADLPAETEWYRPRTLTSWRALAWFLIAFHFAVPFAILLSRRAKMRRSWLGVIAALLLFAHLGDAFWLIVPNFRPRGFTLRWTDICAALGMAALWGSVYSNKLRTTRWSTGSIQVSSANVERVHG
jgi:hypothetical protein